MKWINKAIKFYKNISIKKKLLLLFFVQIIIPIVFIGFLSYFKFSDVLKEQSKSYSQDILRLIELRFDDLNSNMNSLTLQLLYDNRIYNYLKTSNSTTSFNYDNYLYCKNIVRDYILSKNEVDSICLIDKNQNYVYFDSDRGKPSIKEQLPYDYVFNKACTSKGKLTWITTKKNDKVDNIYVARVIYDRDDFTPTGLIVLMIKKDYLESVYKDLSSESTKNISILTEKNEDILSRNNWSTKYIKNLKFNGSRGYGIYNKTLITYVKLKEPNFNIIYHIPLNQLYSKINNLKSEFLIIISWSILILSLFSIMTATDFTKPIKELVLGMKKFEKEGKHEDLIVNRNDELGYLSESFNNMSKKLDHLMNMIYKEELTRKEAELKSLQAQINPHFLYNTLENINWMAQLNGVNEISDMVTSLASIMEATIGRDHKLITLREELTYIDNYISILKYRFEDKLNLIKDISEDTKQALIPKLLIQPIIENAIYHGIENIDRKGEIKIHTSLNESILTIEVIDNGVGMTEDELKELNLNIESQENENIKKSIGLINVNKRIKLFYGNDYGLKILSKYNEFTSVSLSVPYKDKEGDL